MDGKRKADDPCDVTVSKKARFGDFIDTMDRTRKAVDSCDATLLKRANPGDVTDKVDQTQKADDPCDVTTPKRANSADVTDRVDQTQKADDPCDVTTPKRANSGDVTDRVDQTQKADDPCDVTTPKRANLDDVTDRVDQTQKADDPCDVTTPKRANSGNVTDRVDRTQKADDPCDVTTPKRANSGDVTDRVDQTQKADDPCDVTTPKRANSGNVTDRVDRTQKADDPCDVTTPKRANSGDVTDRVDQTQKADDPCDVPTPKRANPDDVTDRVDGTQKADDPCDVTTPKRANPDDVTDRVDQTQKADDPCDVTTPKRANSGDVTDRVDQTQKADDPCDVTTPKRANPDDVTDRVDQTQKADDPCDVTTPKRANLGDVTDRVDQTQKADDPCDVTTPKRANPDDVIDRVDQTQKADDPCDVTTPKRANSGDVTDRVDGTQKADDPCDVTTPKRANSDDVTDRVNGTQKTDNPCDVTTPKRANSGDVTDRVDQTQKADDPCDVTTPKRANPDDVTDRVDRTQKADDPCDVTTPKRANSGDVTDRVDGTQKADDPCDVTTPKRANSADVTDRVDQTQKADDPCDVPTPKRANSGDVTDRVDQTQKADDPCDVTTPKRANPDDVTDRVDQTQKADDPCDVTTPKRANPDDVTDRVDQTQKADDPCDVTTPKRANLGDVTDRLDQTQKANDPCDVTTPKRANSGDVTDKVDQTQKADDPYDVPTPKRANSGDVTDRVDQTQKADDPCDASAPKRANSGDVTDSVDRTQKADDPCDASARKRAQSGDMTEGVVPSLPAPHGSRQSTSSVFNNYTVTGMTGGEADIVIVTGVNYPAETELKIKSRDPAKHVSTYAESDAFSHLRAYGSVIIRGRSGSGKSHLGYTLLERVTKSCQRIPVKISSPDEWNYIHKSSTPNAEKKYVVMVDDIFGRTNLIKSSFNTWRQKFDHVWPFVESGQIWLVMTSRPEIIAQGEPEIKSDYDVIKKSKEIILDEGKYCLREAEKQEFLDKLCGKYVRKEDVKEIANMNTALGFPQCCTFFAANENARLKGVEFFKKPFEFIKDLIECVKKNQPKVYFVLLLVFMNEGQLSMKELKSVEHDDKFERQFKTITSCCMLKKARLKKPGIKYVAQSICGVYLFESSRCFLFSHRSIYDVLFVALCEDSPDLGIKMSTPVTLLEFIRISKRKLERCKMEHNVVCLDEEDYPLLANKLREYLSNEDTQYIVLSHPALQNTKFLSMIFQGWNDDYIYKLSRHNGKKVVKNITLPLSEKLGMPKTVYIRPRCKYNMSETVNFLEYNLFLSHVIMNRMKEFASRIIESLSTYDSEDIQTILNEALLCALYTCEKDLATTLLSLGAKPNMLCFRTLCNSPQLDADTSSSIISKVEGNETSLKLLLRIAVISCNKTVIRGLIKKLNALSENHEQFYSHCLELLLKINGNGHEDIRQKTTNAGHEVFEVMTLLEEGGGKLDSRKISLASRHKDPSVLRSLLLRSCDGIHVTDKIGRTPLHLACLFGGADGVELLLKHGAELSVDKDGSTPFHHALKSCVDQREKLKLLLNKNSSNNENFVNLTNNRKCTALHYAARRLDSDCVKMLLEAKADTNVLDVHEQSPLFYVLDIPEAKVMFYRKKRLYSSLLTEKENCHKVVQALLEKGADVGIGNKDKTPLHCAAWNQCKECVELLLPVSDVNAQDSDGNTALHCAVLDKTDPDDFQTHQTRCHEVVKALLDKKGANAGIRNNKDEIPLHNAAQDQCMECVELLLPASDVNVQDSDGNTALHFAVLDRTSHYRLLSHRPRRHEVVKALLEKGADAGIRNKKDETPLHCAARGQCMECVDLLLPVSDVNAQDRYGDTALHCAVLDRTRKYSFQSHGPRHHEVVKALLDKGADVAIRNKAGATLLHHAAWSQCMECIKQILPLSDVNAQDSDGNTALHFAVLDRTDPDDFQSFRPHCREVVKALLDKGANAGIRNNKDETPLHNAAQNQCMECVELLLPASDVNAQDSYGNTALHFAVLDSSDPDDFQSFRPDCHEVVKALLDKKGANAGIMNKKDETPLHYAAQDQCMECVELLLPASDVNAQDSDGNTVLHFAVPDRTSFYRFQSHRPHCHEVVKAVLAKGANAGIRNKKGATPLHHTAWSQCMECIKQILPLSDVNAQDSDGDTALHCAVLHRTDPDYFQPDRPHCREVVKALLDKGANAGIRNNKDEIPLHNAAQDQCMKCVELLLPASDVNAQDSDGNTALHCAVLDRTYPDDFQSHRSHCYEVVKALLDKKGANAGIMNEKDETPLHYAAQNQCKECVGLLLPVSDVNAQDSDGDTALHCAVTDRTRQYSFQSHGPRRHEVVKALLAKGADVAIRNKKGATLLHHAAWSQCMECIKQILPVLDVNAQDSDGNTALHFAVPDRTSLNSCQSYRPHCHEEVKALLAKGANAGIRNKKDETPLQCAARGQCQECVELLLPVSDVNAQDCDGDTALHWAVLDRTSHYRLLSHRPHCHEVVKALLDKGADAGIRNKKDETPLHCAARGRCMECVDLLLPLSDVNAQDSDGNTALHCAFPDRTNHYSYLSHRPRRHEVVKALLDKGADVAIRNEKDETPLHYAAQDQCVECVDLLLPVSDVNAQDSDGNTALQLAVLDKSYRDGFRSHQPRRHEVVKALLDKGADVAIRNEKDETPLHYAAQDQCVECVDLLLPVSDVNAQDSDGNTALQLAVLDKSYRDDFRSHQPRCYEVVKVLLDKGADVEIRNNKDETPLHYAAQNQCMECVDLLLPVSDVNAQDSDGNTALQLAVLDKSYRDDFRSHQPRCYEVVKVLLDKGADVEIRNNKDETPLHYAAQNQCMECVGLLLPVSDVNAQDSDGNTALHCALPDRPDPDDFQSHRPHCHEVVKVLLAKGADVGIRNKKDETPFYYAAGTQCEECVELSQSKM